DGKLQSVARAQGDYVVLHRHGGRCRQISSACSFVLWPYATQGNRVLNPAAAMPNCERMVVYSRKARKAAPRSSFSGTIIVSPGMRRREPKFLAISVLYCWRLTVEPSARMTNSWLESPLRVAPPASRR